MTHRSALLALVLGIGLVLPAPALAADRDGDGLRDGWEIRYGVTSPDDPDSDGDGVIDSAEDEDRDKLGNLGEQRFGTNPAKRDTDGDGRADGREDHDGDGRSNAKEQDQRPLPKGLKPSLRKAGGDLPEEHRTCLTKNGKSALKRCVFGDTTSDTTIVLTGDSHALMWLPAFEQAASAGGWKLVTLFKGACPPVLGIRTSGQYSIDRSRSCERWRAKAHAWMAEDPPALVVLAHADSYRIVDRRGRTIRGSKRVSTWRNKLQATVASLPEASDVLVFGDAPNNAGHVVRCLKRHRSDMSACTMRRESRSERTIERALQQGAVRSGAAFRTLYGKVCTYDPCPLVQGRVLMWRDASHLTQTITERLAPSVEMLLNEVLEEFAAKRVTSDR